MHSLAQAAITKCHRLGGLEIYFPTIFAPDTVTLRVRDSMYEYGRDTIQCIAMHTFSTVVKVSLSCYYVDSKVEKFQKNHISASNFLHHFIPK